MPLTDVTCRSAKGRAEPYKLSDSGGLHLLVNPGRVTLLALAYRWHGKQRTLACGVYPAVALAEARASRDDAKRQLAVGLDPSAVKKERSRAARLAVGNTFEALAREWHDNWKPGRTARYAAQILRRLEVDVFPAIGRRPIAEIEPPEILDMLRKVEGRGVGETAQRLKQLVSQTFRYAVATGRAKRDPCSDLRGALKATAAPEHHKAIPLKEIPGFLRSIETYDGEPRTRLALRLVVLTFLRTTELRAARWDELEGLDGPNPLWRVPPDRMKKRREHLVPLSRQAVAVLQDLRGLAGNSAFVFPSTGAEGFMSNNTMLYALYRLGYRGRATVHGFRGVASTVLNESGFNRDWIERQLAHVEGNAVRAAYNAAEWLPERKRMMQWWADHLDSLAGGGNVVPLPVRA